MNMTPRLLQHEAHLCLLANRWCRRSPVRALFATVSRLGDGVAWYALMLAIVVVDGYDGLVASTHMAATGLAALTLYTALKRWTRRPRPYASDRRILALVPALDEFSFPSGHTLHAVSFAVVAIAYYPLLAIALVPFVLAIAASRVVLGLHYPSDVLAAGVIAAGLASLSLGLLPAA
ncbi:MAG: phosphatase PAP2 family protein [Lysobacteraceae bacterium]